MTALLELAKALGIDPGPLNQADLQEQTCSAALKEINKQARLLMMTRRLWLAGMESRNYFVRLADKVMAEKEVLEQERNELAALAALKAQGPVIPELKPVAWTWEYRGFAMVTASDGQAAMLEKDPNNKVTPLYAIPGQVKAQWQADILAEISLQVSASKPEATPMQIATAILTESKRIRQRAQEAGNVSRN